ncbi:CDC14-domain-containing protein [Phanerochaete sordida]|uniref:CDC14-domain-containing protein n=1 Tax=Phanerochaete sordida TaxID=48140 RepID=A0A9P3L718_9APHY|nr:CDC14-domain-containing protein [Phanerochaete sordida]
MYNAIQDALDDLASFRSSAGRQGRALDTLERLLADICVPGDAKAAAALRAFSALQETFQCNVPSRILPWIADRTLRLDALSNKGSVAPEHAPEATMISAQLMQSLNILQGVLLNHGASKHFLGRRFALEVLVDLLLVSRHVSPAPAAKNEDGARKNTPPVTLASAVLDTLLCIMVDSSPALRAFEEAGGVRAVVRILKRAGTPRETRMKCLEFLYFYLLDENTSDTQNDDTYVPTAPNSPSSSTHTRNALSMSQMSDSSVGSDVSTSSAGSYTSTSTTATTVSSTSRKSSTSDALEPAALVTSPTARPGHRKTLSRDSSAGTPRPLAFLRKDLDFVPQTPAGKSALDLKTPRAPRLRAQPSTDSTPSLTPATSAAAGEGEWKTPRRLPPRMLSLGEAAHVHSDPSTPARRGHRRTQTPDEPDRAQSVPTSPTSPVCERGLHAAVAALGSAGTRRPGVRTMEEKKAILGSMMGNVDTLVEGVKRAGIWGVGV